jgi:glycogen debranching enzyme
MDAKMGDWVVTPRRGKAVEINALWYNSLRLLERWVREELADQDTAMQLAKRAEDAEAPFTPRGCVAQAWSVAEVLRSWVTTS